MGKIGIKMANKKAYSSGPSRNLMDPYLTQTHMASHYNRILSAKASVDCSVPKSMLLSVKYKDQLKKQNLQTKYQKGFISARSESWSSSGSSGRLTVTESIQNPSILENNEYARDLANGSVTPERTYVTSKGNFSVLPSTANINKETTQKTFSRCYSDLSSRISTSPRQHYRTFCRSSTSLANSQRCCNSFQDVRQKTYSGDILEKHAHHFTNGQQFTPRILKKEAQSSLAHYRYYTPVKKKKLSKKKLVTQETQTDFTSSQDTPALKNKKDRSHLASLQVCSDDEQEDRNVLSQNFHCKEPQECFECTYDYSVQRLSTSNRIKSPIMRKVKAEEEELKYLEFISDITSEILTRGLFSNSVLERIFERRIEENRHRLDEQKLRHMLEELKEDLGCKPEKNWKTSDCETVLTKTKMIKLNNCDSLENLRFAHNWREETDRTVNISINNENDKSWDHRLHGNFSAVNCYDQNVTGNTTPHDICGEQIQKVQDLEQDHCLVANSEENHGDLQSVDHSDSSTDYNTVFDGTTELTEIDNLAVSLHIVDVKENCEPEDVWSGSALSKESEKAFDDGINL
ncbi:spermatogenesis-associated protein 7 isoform X2 [Carcharodon carcharias]|uniref:spermatogenesis-associated protein 7 isoform X2 n=1 Tax=Carcharodon carcharias TaxID=13397 RepID=UPI001B7F0AF9|nr:spermatogenesis-associated protein 7 isoform X2 [Carcharodon carcharias]